MKKTIFLSLFSILLFLQGCKEESGLITETHQFDNEASYGDALEKGKRSATFEIRIENLTPATGPGASQPLSPPVMVTHTSRFHIFKNHKYASTELGQLAEDAVNAPLLKMLEDSPFAYGIIEGSGGPIFPGEEAIFHIKTTLPFKKSSFASMLVNTNDGFTGTDAVNLPLIGTREYYLYAYDAGTEINTEAKANIPGPCCGSPMVRVPENNKINMHQGILGSGDLDPNIYGWSGHVAKLTIIRIN